MPYQEAVGCLLYLAQCTRPDIAHALGEVSRYNSNHDIKHWKAVKRIIRYLKGTINYKFQFNSNNLGIIGYSDADWASDAEDRRSCTGYVFKMAGGAISWRSTRQKTIALSSTEAEYIALSSSVQEAVWLQQLSEELRLKKKPIQIYCDNQSTIKLSTSDGYKPRTKHIDIRHHYIREAIGDQKIMVEFIESKRMVADSLTKAVSKEKTLFCLKEIGLVGC